MNELGFPVNEEGKLVNCDGSESADGVHTDWNQAEPETNNTDCNYILTRKDGNLWKEVFGQGGKACFTDADCGGRRSFMFEIVGACCLIFVFICCFVFSYSIYFREICYHHNISFNPNLGEPYYHIQYLLYKN